MHKCISIYRTGYNLRQTFDHCALTCRENSFFCSIMMLNTAQLKVLGLEHSW